MSDMIDMGDNVVVHLFCPQYGTPMKPNINRLEGLVLSERRLDQGQFTVLDFSLLASLYLLGAGKEASFPKCAIARLVGVSWGSTRVNTVYELEELGLLRLSYREADRRVYLSLTPAGIESFQNHIERCKDF